MDNLLLSRLSLSIKRLAHRMNLNLNGLVVVTECASGPYSCTPAIAALAGATKVVAFGKNSPYGNFEAAHEEVLCLWRELGLSKSVLTVTDNPNILNENLQRADIVTNSGHLRPLNADRIKRMKKGCVIPLMYEAWEFRYNDVCLKTCQECGIPVAGTNERHPEIGVFEYLGPLVAKSLFNSGLEVCGNSILLICDNDFSPYIEKTLRNIGTNVLKPGYGNNEIDGIVFAHTPSEVGGTIDIPSLELPHRVPVCCQLWGNVDRSFFKTKWVPEREPEAGHMGIMLSSLGMEPIVRLQTGGLKVGEVLWRKLHSGVGVSKAVEAVVRSKWGQKVVL